MALRSSSYTTLTDAAVLVTTSKLPSEVDEARDGTLFYIDAEHWTGSFDNSLTKEFLSLADDAYEAASRSSSKAIFDSVSHLHRTVHLYHSTLREKTDGQPFEKAADTVRSWFDKAGQEIDGIQDLTRKTVINLRDPHAVLEGDKEIVEALSRPR